jgi:hypothetical protein
MPGEQGTLFESPHERAGDGHSEVARALDDLVGDARRYRNGQDFHKLLEFVAGFRGYSAFNAMLVHLQLDSARFVAPSGRWHDLYRRRVTAQSRPLIILQPFGPVMIVFDVSDTEPIDNNSPPLPPQVLNPFEVLVRADVSALAVRTEANAIRDGVRVLRVHGGSQAAGHIRPAHGADLELVVRRRPEWVVESVPLRYELAINRDHSASAAYATLVHELAHLYCGHLGAPDSRWWPNRSMLSDESQEFEAETISYLVCRRADSRTQFPPNLAQHLDHDEEVPPISLEQVLVASDLIEKMGRQWLPRRPGPRDTPGPQPKAS